MLKCFVAVEICFPYDEAVENLKTGATLKTILINTDPGEYTIVYYLKSHVVVCHSLTILFALE